MIYTITGQIKSGKNNMLITKTGHHYPNPSWARWRDEVVFKLRLQKSHTLVLDKKCAAVIKYSRGDERRRDVPGMIDALWHCLEKAGIVKDDCLIVDVQWIDQGLNRDNPAVLLDIIEKEAQ